MPETPAPSREPLPCPFCGSAPSFTSQTAMCVNDHCGIGFCVMSPAMWNRRAPLAPETPDVG
jgi:hypothetical protein